MSPAPSLEERVTSVEHDLAELKSQMERSAPQRGWIDKITGSFKDDPDFEEILRLGREIRQADLFKLDDN